MKASQTGGVKPMDLAGRFTRERERCSGMTDADRSWRMKYLKDMEIAHDEPRFVPELYKELMNPIRRFYRAPMDAVGKALEPVMGASKALKTRWLLGKGFMTLWLTFGAVYYLKYNPNDWTRKGGVYTVKSRIAVFPGDPDYPKASDKVVPADYASRGFKENKLNL